jgi:hypothetical protein
MAGTKKTEVINEVKDGVKNDAKIDSPISETQLDISAIIKQAVAETAMKYQTTIDDQANKIKDLENKIANANQNTSGFNANKRVKIMHMGVGSANFSKGRVNVNFDQPFDTRDVRYDIFEEMYDLFYEWFKNFELVVLDKDVREYVGLEHDFKIYGADKSTFEEILSLDNSECLKRVGLFKPMMAMTFLKFYIDEYLNHNPKTMAKFTDIVEFYKSHYGIDEMQEAIREMAN